MAAAETQTEFFDVAEVGLRFVIRTRGYAGKPATGPAGETCGSCRHLCRIQRGHGDRVWRKCSLVSRGWTWSDRTEVRVSAPACELFEAVAGGGRKGGGSDRDEGCEADRRRGRGRQFAVAFYYPLPPVSH